MNIKKIGCPLKSVLTTIQNIACSFDTKDSLCNSCFCP